MSLRKQKSCKYCGNNPVPHFFTWYFESLNLFFSGLGRSVREAFGMKGKRRPGRYHIIARFFFTIGRALFMISFNTDLKACKIRRAQVLWEEAERRGIKMREVKLWGRSLDYYIAEVPSGRKIYFNGLPRPHDIDERVWDIMDDKMAFKKCLQKAKLPVAAGDSIWNFAQAKRTFAEIRKLRGEVPVIVKPRTGSRGRHTSTFVYNLKELEKAYKIAKQLCFWVIVEEQFMGPVYRATVINYKLAGVLRGDPPQVIGDGKSTMRELIELQNKKRSEKVSEIKITPELKDFLAKQNLRLSSLLAKGKLVNLSEKIGISYGGSSSEDFEICHADNKQVFEKAAKALGDPIVGFDFIIEDIQKSWKKQRCGFIEANSQPFINLHHDPLLGNPRNVAGAVWEMVLADS